VVPLEKISPEELPLLNSGDTGKKVCRDIRTKRESLN
jgi:hypothetical protein